MPYINIDTEWEEYYPKVYGYFFRRLDNRLDVEDLTSLVLSEFLKVIINPEKSYKILNKNAYLWKIAHNQLSVFINTKSKQAVLVGLDDNFEILDERVELERSLSYQDKINSLLHCIQNNLTDIDYKIVNLSLIEDRKSPEVATILNLSAENIRKRLSRSVAKLKVQCVSIWKN